MAKELTEVAIVGALAYDQISTTNTRFTPGANPLLNCKLLTLKEAFGGCGSNIAYNIAALGGNPMLVTCTGTADDARFITHCDYVKEKRGYHRCRFGFFGRYAGDIDFRFGCLLETPGSGVYYLYIYNGHSDGISDRFYCQRHKI